MLVKQKQQLLKGIGLWWWWGGILNQVSPCISNDFHTTVVQESVNLGPRLVFCFHRK